MRLLRRLAETFQGKVYRHRSATLGNLIGSELFEDLFEMEVSQSYKARVLNHELVVNTSGRIRNPLKIRRNDSVCGRPPAGIKVRVSAADKHVSLGPVAEPQIGCEVKILGKSFLKQIDRVINDLVGFRGRMHKRNPNCLNVAVVAVNFEPDYVSYEKDRAYKDPPRDGEARETSARIINEIGDDYDELIIIPFKATNSPPYPFSLVNEKDTALDYGAVLTRLGAKYNKGFP